VFRRALKIIAIAVPTLLIFFAVAGPYILTAFNISIADFRIAGGIVLLVIGIDTLREGAPRTMGLSPEDYVFVPIVTPMLVGPGAITSVMLFSTYYGLPEVIVSIAIASLVTYLVIRFGFLIMRVVGVNMLRFIGRFMSLIIMAWAVSLIIQGLKETMPI
jgi:multiple antibiotic resistance protein